MNHIPISNWPNIPKDIYLKEATSVATDSKDNVYIFNRGEIPVLVLKSIFVRYVNSGTKITPPPTPRRPDNMPPVKPIIK